MDQNQAVGKRPALVTMRIPGVWSGPEDFLGRLAVEHRCDGEKFWLADGTEFEFDPLPADKQFGEVFASSCSKLPTEDERQRIENYTVNICLTGPGGSVTAAKKLMAGAAAIMDAGGAGVFIDNSGLSHGASDWRTLLEGADQGGVYWAFVNTVRNEQEIYSVGMQILGFRDAVLPRIENEAYAHQALHSFLGFTAFSGSAVKDSETFTDPILPTLQAFHQPHDRFEADCPMHNPYGQWRLVKVGVEQN